MELKTSPPHTHDSIRHLAVSLTGDKQQRHLGMLAREEDGTLNLIHLGWHNYFRCDPPPLSGGWVECQHVQDDLQKLFADWLFSVWSENQDAIPYGFCYRPEDEYFGLDNTYVNSEPGKGLTCATFVLECFKQFELHLIDHQSWVFRDEDTLWKLHIIQRLKDLADRFNIPEGHILALEQNINDDARFRPEEVAAAATQYQGESLTFGQVLPLSERLLAEFEKTLL